MEKSTARLYYTKEVYVSVSQEMVDEILKRIDSMNNIDVLREFEIIEQVGHVVHVVPLSDLYDSFAREEVEAILEEYFVVDCIEGLHYFNLRVSK